MSSPVLKKQKMNENEHPSPDSPASELEESTQIRVLTEREKEIIQDSARCHDFFDWLNKYKEIPFRLLFSAFDCELPTELAHSSIDRLLPLLKAVMMRKIARRPKRTDINTLQDVLTLLEKSKLLFNQSNQVRILLS